MESRRIKLLTIAYFDGRLDFKKRNTWDKTREDIVLYAIEQSLLSEIYAVKTLRDAIISVALIPGNPQAIHLSEKPFNDYIRFKLPSLIKRPKIDKPNNKATRSNYEEIMKEHAHLIGKVKK